MPSLETLNISTLALLTFGSVVLIFLACVPATRRTAREAMPILLTEVVIVGTVVAAFWLGGWVLFLALLLHAAHVSYEAGYVARQRSRLALPPPVLFGILIAALAWAVSLLSLWLLAALVVAGLVAALTLRRGLHPMDPLAVRLEVAFFPILPLIFFTAAGLQGSHGAWLLLAFLLVETFDSYALLGGKLVGRTPAFPTLSPRKTREGLITGAVMLMATAALGAWVLGAPRDAALAIALLVAPLAVAGDLAASRLKRASGVKDFPQILPRQGGVLDITDAWIVTGSGLVILSMITS